MKTLLLLFCVLLPVLPACMARHPQIPYEPVPAGPLVQALENLHGNISSLRALARVETERGSTRRAYESVAILERGYQRLRLEAYGPLGERRFALLWSGSMMTAITADGSGPRMLDPAGLERVIGVSLLPEDLCAVLAGSVPQLSEGTAGAAGCSSDGRCAVDILVKDGLWRVHLQKNGGTGRYPRVTSVERYRGGSLVLLIRYEHGTEQLSELPRRIIAQHPDRELKLTVDYLDAEVNVPLADALFSLAQEEEGEP